MSKTIVFPILAQYYIQYSEQTLECSLCFQPSLQIFECKGACGKYFCNECIRRQSKTQCINNCSSNCFIQPLLLKKVQFFCPYNAQKCKSSINSRVDFQRHVKECQFIHKGIKQQIQYRSNFKCEKGHQLIFINDRNYYDIFKNGSLYFVLSKLQCNNCHSIALGTSLCMVCSKFKQKIIYCCICRPVPCDKMRCPIGHNFQLDRPAQLTICNLCGIFCKLYNNYGYRDDICNMDVCYRCYEKLPQVNQLIPINNTFEKQPTIQRKSENPGCIRCIIF